MPNLSLQEQKSILGQISLVEAKAEEYESQEITINIVVNLNLTKPTLTKQLQRINVKLQFLVIARAGILHYKAPFVAGLMLEKSIEFSLWVKSARG